MNNFAKRNFNLILFLSTIAGFILPQFGEVSGYLILGVLSFIIFSSSFKVSFSVEFFRDRAKSLFLFYMLRFLAIPVALFYLVLPFSPFYASCVFLLFILPAGVTAPAFTNVFRGNIALALVLLILSSFLIPFLMPFLSSLLMTEVIEIDRLQLFSTLFITVIFPYLLHLPFRKNSRMNLWMQNHDSFISVMGIALIFALAIAEYRPVLLSEPNLILPFFIVALAGFVGMYLFGWIVFRQAPQEDKVALLFVSGANNVALGVVISFLYFPAETGIFFIVCEIAWVLILIPIKKVMAMVAKRS